MSDLDGQEREALARITKRIERAAEDLAHSPYGNPRPPDKDKQVAKLRKLARDCAALAAREESQLTDAQRETAAYLTATLGELERDGVVSAKRGDQEFFLRPDGTLESGIMDLNQAEVEGLPHRVGVKRRVPYDDMVGRVESMLLGQFGVNYPQIQWNSVSRRVLDLAVELVAAREEPQHAKTHEPIARAFHEAYEKLAPEWGYKTRPESAVPWEQVPAANKGLMCSVIHQLIEDGVLAAREEPKEVTAEGLRA